ncbi:MAG TPA: hypothetical protein PKD54_02720 [Pirellulaceae bacterium]|nr:hypothetical protein [Pirellulaceae bacterium]
MGNYVFRVVVWACTAQAILAANSGTNSIEGAGARRHPVSVIEADVYVQKFSTIVRLKCFADELELFQGVTPLSNGFYDPDEIDEATQDHARYLLDRLDLMDSEGHVLQGQIVEVIEVDLPDEGIRAGELMNFMIGYHFEYRYDEPPEFITIRHRLSGDNYLFPAEFKVLLRQAGSDQPYFQMMKPDQPESFRFDWSNPILSSDASEKDWEAWFNEQRETMLGITSYSNVYSFIYITPYQVRHELLIPLANLATVIDLERADPAFLDIAEQDQARRQLEAYFQQWNPVEIDGMTVQPVFDRVDFYGLNFRDFAVRAPSQRISMASGRVGLIMSYSAKSPPDQVSLTWTMFNDAVRTVDAVVFALDDVLKTQFSRFIEDNTFRWSSPTRIELPTIEEILVESPPISPIRVPVVAMIGGVLVVLVVVTGKRWMGTVGACLTACALLIGVFLTWQVGSVEIVRSGPPIDIPPAVADEVFRRLHANVFRAFDYYRESDIYDALAKSVAGPLLRDLYLQLRQSLEVKEQGGAIARIDHVEMVEGELQEIRVEQGRLGFGYRCRWNLVGTVEHWGHLHQRTNQYDGEFRIDLVDGGWKITKMQTLDEQQGPVKTSLRQF